MIADGPVWGILGPMRRLLILVALLGATAVAAPVELHYFWAPTCPDCARMKEFLDGLAAQFPELAIVRHEVAVGNEAFELMAAVAQAYGLKSFATPLVAVGNVATTGVGVAVELALWEEVARCALRGCPSPLSRLPPAPAPSAAPPTGAGGSRGVPVVLLVGLGVALALVLLWALTR